jgi:AbrB family looped-hinge helix DNA binding protein
MTTTVSSKGQIVIPAPIRQRLQLRPGDQLSVNERENEIVLKKAGRTRKKPLVQWMLDCPAADFQIDRLRDRPKDVKL